MIFEIKIYNCVKNILIFNINNIRIYTNYNIVGSN